jgi:hypothetical protein
VKKSNGNKTKVAKAKTADKGHAVSSAELARSKKANRAELQEEAEGEPEQEAEEADEMADESNEKKDDDDMNHYSLKKVQETKAGFTDMVVIKASDLTDTVFDEAQNIKIATLMAGDVVMDKTLVEVITPLSPNPSANATVTVSVGRTASGYVDCLPAFTLINNGAPTAAGQAAVTGATVGSQVIAADNTALYAQMDIVDTDGFLATITTGEVRIWLCISRRDERTSQA